MLFFINFAMDKKKVNVKEKVGGYLFDVSKYVLTAVLVTMFFNDISSSKLMTYAIGAVVALGTLIWGIVFYNDVKYIELVKKTQKKYSQETEIYSYFTKAIQALKQGNPFLYSPGFLDRENVWKLDKNLK